MTTADIPNPMWALKRRIERTQGIEGAGAAGAVRAVCAALRSVCVADDCRPLDVAGGGVPGGRYARLLNPQVNPNSKCYCEHGYGKQTPAQREFNATRLIID